ncbi:conserved Plasmodium protein, unknown function [Plasmodium knowlesi strain H]|uniref:Rhoptry neck protein 3 n=2 Tax=Plasmodium knowlesi TaxID=5850 RepID=B3L1F9_PLAKH|nr:conserved Plasmodium protein, unknown function [Plasmodium knowlesi strain H]OTN67977.1 Uncharacterized protein PKNOH_S04358100 [Plasmodium knowlesi]CAA9986944.1 conserved Plasmodium protein, unknown function [Plasmodium knowlesi strain H]VVS76418.1 conserved Plasmodium protein, unknown function [Plasmodium knowlesi strain H]|eukprot:XP_002258191.1 hypothetical protein, conserved in Plasmodium species [Plasmodium knowlesi strain H]
MKHAFLPILFFLLLFTKEHDITTCFQLKTTPLFLNNQKFTSYTQRGSYKRAILRLEKSFSTHGESLKRSNVDKSDVYENIEKFVTNSPFTNRSKNDSTNTKNLDRFTTSFVSSPDMWNEVVIDDMNSKDVTRLTKFLYAEYKRAFASIDEKRNNADNTFNSEKIKSLFLSLGSVAIDNMNTDEFFKHLESYSLLLKCCKDNYVSFSFIKNEIGNIMNTIIKHSQNYLHDKHICDRMKNEFVNMHNLIKDIKKNDTIKMNIKSFFSVLNTNVVLNNNYVFHFLTEIFSALNLLMRDNPNFIHHYEYIINPHFFFISIFSLYSYNLSKARFYYVMLLIHNQINLENPKENVAKYDDTLNYNEYKSHILNTIFEKEKKECEYIKGIIANNKEGGNTFVEKKDNMHDESLDKDPRNEKEGEDAILNDEEESLVKGCKHVLFKELYDNVLIKLLLFYVFFFFSDHYFCTIILLNFKNSIKDRNKDDRLLQIANYLFSVLLDSLYPVRDYSNIVLLLSLYKNNFDALDDKSLSAVKKIFNAVVDDNTREETSGDMSKLLLDISESIKSVENEKNHMNKKITNNSNENKNAEEQLYTNSIILKEGESKEEIVKCDGDQITEQKTESETQNVENKDASAKDSNRMKDKFNKYLLRLLKNKSYDKIERLEKRDNLYVNNKTYSLFIQSFLSNHKYDRVYKVYKKMKLKKNIPIKYLNAKNLIHSFKNCDIDKGHVLNELQLISKSYLNLYFSKDCYFVLAKTMLYKHMCDYLKKKCDMNLMIDIFNFNELLKYFIKFKSFINIKKLYFLLLKYSYIKTYKTYVILIRFFNNLNYESEKGITEEEARPVSEGAAEDLKCPFEKNMEIYRDIVNLRKNKLSHYIFQGINSDEDFNLYNKVYEIAKKDKYDMSLFILSNFITEYIFIDYGSDDIVESELTNVNNILNIFFEAINLFFYKENYRITVNIFFFLLLFLNYYVTRYTKKDLKYSTFLKKNILNFFLSNNYEAIKVNSDDVYSYVPHFILRTVSMSVNHLKNAHNLKDIISSEWHFDSSDFNKNVILAPAVNCKNIMSIFLLLKNNLIMCDKTMEKDLYDKQKSNNNQVTENVSVHAKGKNYLYRDVIEKNYSEQNGSTEQSAPPSTTYSNVANVFVKLKYTIGSDTISEDSLKDFLFNKLRIHVNSKNIDALITTLSDIFFTYNNIIYLNSRDYLNVYEKLSLVYDSALASLTVIFFLESRRNLKEGTAPNVTTATATTATVTTATSTDIIALPGGHPVGEGTKEVSFHEYISILRAMDKAYFKDILNGPTVCKLLKKYENFIHMCLYFDLNKKKVGNVITLLDLSRKCNIPVSTETLVDVFSLYFERKMNDLIFKEFESFPRSEGTKNFELYYIVMKAAFFEENAKVALNVLNAVLKSFDIKRLPLNFFEGILLILKKKGKYKDLYQSIDRLHRELINFEKNEKFTDLEKLTANVKSDLHKCKTERQF